MLNPFSFPHRLYCNDLAEVVAPTMRQVYGEEDYGVKHGIKWTRKKGGGAPLISPPPFPPRLSKYDR